MVEGGSLEVSEAEILEALKVAQKGIRDVIGLERQLMDKAGTAVKLQWTKAEADAELQGRAQDAAEGAMAQAINAADKAARSAGVRGVKEQTLSALLGEYPERGREISNYLEDIEYRVMRKQ